MIQFLHPLPIWLLCVLAFTGCTGLNDRPVTTFTTTPAGSISRGVDPYTLIRKLQIRNAASHRDSGLLHAQVEVFNKRRFPVQFRYKFVWIQDNGFTDETSSAWRTHRIESQATLPLSDSQRCGFSGFA